MLVFSVVLVAGNCFRSPAQVLPMYNFCFKGENHQEDRQQYLSMLWGGGTGGANAGGGVP